MDLAVLGRWFAVHDTGIGIPPGRLQNIFEAFHRLEPTRSDGLGLGLRREPRGGVSSASNRGALYGWSRFLLHGPCECIGSRLAVTGEIISKIVAAIPVLEHAYDGSQVTAAGSPDCGC